MIPVFQSVTMHDCVRLCYAEIRALGISSEMRSNCLTLSHIAPARLANPGRPSEDIFAPNQYPPPPSSDSSPERPSLEHMLDTYFRLLPQYQVWLSGSKLVPVVFLLVSLPIFPQDFLLPL